MTKAKATTHRETDPLLVATPNSTPIKAHHAIPKPTAGASGPPQIEADCASDTSSSFATRLTSAGFSCCSMSLKMPTAARQAISYVTNLFSASTSTAQISTELSTKSENGKGSFAHHHQPNHHNSVNGATNKLMPPTGMTSPTHSNGSSDISDESILNWEPDVHEKELVKKTWSDDFDFLYELGAAIYTYIFEHNPNTKQLFPTIHRHGEHWKDSKEFRSQALKFVQTLAHVVKNLYHMERLAPYLYKIGEIHVKFAKRGFKPEFWNSFLDAMEVALADTIQRNPELTIDEKVEATQVWRRLAHYVISHMKRGYSEKEASCHE